MARFVLFIVLFAAIAFSQVITPIEDDDTIWVGRVHTDNNKVSNFYTYSRMIEVGTTLWRDNVNKNGGFNLRVGNTSEIRNYKIAFRDVDCGIAPASIQASNCYNKTLELCQGLAGTPSAGRVDFILVAYSSTLTPPIAQASEACKVLNVSPLAASTAVYRCTEGAAGPECTGRMGQRRWLYGIGTQAVSPNFMSEYVYLVKIKQAKSIGFFAEDQLFNTYIVLGARNLAEDLNLPVLYDVIIKSASNRLVPDTGATNFLSADDKKNLEDLTTTIISFNADAIVGGTYQSMCTNVVTRLRQRNYVPPSIAMSECAALKVHIGHWADFVIQSVGWDYRMKGREYTENLNNYPWQHFPASAGETSSQNFNKQYKAHPKFIEFGMTGEAPYQGVTAYSNGYCVSATLYDAGTTDKDVWLEKWHALKFNSIWGNLELDNAGANVGKSFIVTQFVPQKDGSISDEVAAPLSSATIDAVVPMPALNERTFDDKWLNSDSELALFIITLIFCLLTIVMMVLLVIWKEKPQIVSASLVFCEIMCIGGLLSITSSLTWTVWSTNFHCVFTPWAMIIGLDLMLGSLLMKNFRVILIFKNAAKLKRTSITNRELALSITAVTIIDIIVLLVWTIGYPIKSEAKIPDAFRPVYNYHVCRTTSPEIKGATPAEQLAQDKYYEDIFLAILGTYKGVQLVAGLVITFMLQYIKIPSAFNESTFIGYALYNLSFSLLVMLIVWRAIPVVDRASALLSYILRNVILLWSLVLTLLSIFVPKIYYVVTGQKAFDTATSRRSSASTEGSSNTGTGGATTNAGGATTDTFKDALDRENTRLRTLNVEMRNKLDAYIEKFGEMQVQGDGSKSASASKSKSKSMSHSRSVSASGSVSAQKSASASASASASVSRSASASASPPPSVSGSASLSASGSA